MKEYICLQCNKIFSDWKFEKRKYCSHLCWELASKGKNNPNYGIKMSEITKRKISKSKKANPTRYWLGKKRTINFSSEKLEQFRKNIIGIKNPNWRGGITSINEALRKTLEYEDWRKAVLERDLYTCQDCGQIGGKLNADHIKRWALYPELRFEVSNGQTLCIDCHLIKTQKELKEDWSNQYRQNDTYGFLGRKFLAG